MVRRWIAPALVGAIAFIAARQAMLPGPGFWDTAELQVVAPVMGTAHPTGFPTYVLLGWLLNIVLSPFGEPALRMNLFAALSIAVAAAVTVDLVRSLTRSLAVGVLAGIGLALTPQIWALGTRAEAHALHLALVAILLRLLVGWEARARSEDPDRRAVADRWLVAAAVAFGLSMGNHSLTLLLAPAVGLFVLAVDPGILRRPRIVAVAAGSLALTVALVFLELPLRAGPFRAPLVYGRPETWDGFWYIVLAEQFRGSLEPPLADLPAKLGTLLARTVTQFGPLTLLVPVGAIATALVRPRYALLSGIALLVTVGFSMNYANADIGRYYAVPILVAWTWIAILAAAMIRTIAGMVAPVTDRGFDQRPRRGVDRAGALAAVMSVALLVPTLAAIPSRHASLDARGDTAARRWIDRTMAVLEPDAVVVSWWSYSTPLWYAQHIDGLRPDVTVIDDRTRLDQDLGDIYDVIDANLDRRPVYVIRDDPREVRALDERYVLAPIDGPDARFLTRVVAPRTTGS
jgi:hypothetical protein